MDADCSQCRKPTPSAELKTYRGRCEACFVAFDVPVRPTWSLMSTAPHRDDHRRRACGEMKPLDEADCKCVDDDE